MNTKLELIEEIITIAETLRDELSSETPNSDEILLAERKLKGVAFEFLHGPLAAMPINHVQKETTATGWRS